MKDKDLLNILGEIDEELIEDAAPSFGENRAPQKKKKSRAWIRYTALAACCTLILCGAMIIQPLMDMINNPVSGETISQPIAEDENTEKLDNNGELDLPVETDGDYGIEEELPFLLVGTISDERFSNFNLLQIVCSSQNVGEKLTETTVVFYDDEGVKYDVRAEINSIVGLDGDIGLCVRYIEEEKNSRINSSLQFDTYWYLGVEDYDFSSFDEMREVFWHDIITNISYVAGYFKNTDEDYCKNFVIDSDAKEMIRQHMLSIDGDAEEYEDGRRLEEIHSACEEMVSFVCYGFLEDFTGGLVQVYDSGYLYFDSLGGLLFNIGEEAARQMIDLVIRQCEPQGYVWNEKENKWYRVFEDDAAQYGSFREALEENKLMDQLCFKEKVGYWEDFDETYPKSLTLEGIFLSGIADVLYACDGNAFAVDNIEMLADESVTLTHEDDYGRSLTITVYDNGYALFGNTFYDIGAEPACKIIAIVRTDGAPTSLHKWHEEDSVWYTICIEDEYRENPAPTFKEAIEQRDLYGKLNFNTTVDYYAGDAGTPPPYFTIDGEVLLRIYEILYAVDGNIVEYEDGRVFNGSTVIFNRQSPYGGDERFLFVYSDGRIGLEFEYYVGKEVTNRIINLIVSGGQPAYGYSWNEEKGIWEKKEPEEPSNGNVGGGVDEYETVDPEELDKIDINVVPTSRFYTIVLHENTKHLNNVLADFRKEQADFMEEIMKNYQAKYSGVTGASFETAKIVSDGILKVPFVIPKEGTDVSSMRLTYYHESRSMFVTYVIGDVSYHFDYCPYLDEYENNGTATKEERIIWNGVEFDIYGRENECFFGKFFYPGLEDMFIQINMTNVNGDITEIPSLDMFEMLYLTPSSDRDIAKVYKEEPVYPDCGEIETMISEGEETVVE